MSELVCECVDMCLSVSLCGWVSEFVYGLFVGVVEIAGTGVGFGTMLL